MTQTMITIRPTPALRRPFAEWAVGQRPKIRTVSTTDFAVPADLFVDVPESVLIGALVDGHRYVSPAEDAATGSPAPGASTARLLDCGLCYEEDGQEIHPHPECLQTTGTDAIPQLNAPASEGIFRCTACERDFTTERGRELHVRAKHSEASDGS